jgi:tRNA(Ile)-lysidine synthase
MDLLTAFQHHIREQKLLFPSDHLLLAVSGGLDSVVLCELCFRSSYQFSIAHCNFQLRGLESDRDEEFVRSMGARYGVEVFAKKFDTLSYATDNRLSTQEAARELRYQWFAGLANAQWPIQKNTEGGKDTLNKPGTMFLLTAHHADDNAETVLMNFCRGTGLHGLTGIPASTGFIRRPLLLFSKEELANYARENNLTYVEDSSNTSVKYTRNFFRHEVVPLIRKVYPTISSNLEDNIHRFIEIEKLYNLGATQLVKKLCRQKGKELHIPIKQLLGYNNQALVYEIIKEYGFTENQVDEVWKLGFAESGSYLAAPSNRYRIIRHRHWFIIAPAQSDVASNIIIEEGEKYIKYPGGQLAIEIKPLKTADFSNNAITGNFNFKEVKYPLLLRKWKQGDYFYPLGMKKKKKLARFLIDLKLSKTEKENTWVIESDKRIMWVVGLRIDERFKLTSTTGTVLRISPSL